MGEAGRRASLPGPHRVQRGSRAVVQGAKGGDWVEGALSPAGLRPLPLVRGAILYPTPRSLVTLADERVRGARCPLAFLLRYVPGVQGLAWGTSRLYMTPPEPPFPESGPRVPLSPPKPTL